MKNYNRLRAVIDLDAVKYNVTKMHQNTPEAEMILVVKTDGYGHGAVQIAREFEETDFVWGYAVATLDEGVVLRKAGIRKPILCLGCIFPDQMQEMIRYEIRMTAYCMELAQAAAKIAGEMGKKAYFHIKLDTGMSRLGFPVTEESADRIAEICQWKEICSEGMFTHFARADETDKTASEEQIRLFNHMKQMLEERNITIPYCHCCNSAGIIDLPEEQMQLVRAGISLYGLYPSDEVDKSAVSLRPVMRLLAHVTFVKWIEPGTPVSYGGTFVADRRMRIATVPAGYGDGYPRSLSGKGYVLIRGKRAPILGRVCMDQFMVDVTDIPDVTFGDEVVLIGTSGGEHITVETLAQLSGRFHYELVCDFNKRVPREFIKDGKVTEQQDWF